MKIIFDTNFIVAYILTSDESHQRAILLEDNENILTSDDIPGNPFNKGALHTGGEITVGYYNTSAQTDSVKGKFYFRVQSLDVNKKPSKQEFILDLAVSNDKGVTKTFLCTNRYVNEDELDEEAEISLSFSLNKVDIKSGTIIYYSIKRNKSDALPTVGELTL